MKKCLAILFIVMNLMIAVTVFAAIKVFDGTGEWHTNDNDDREIAMSRAAQRAQIDAQKKAGVYLKTFSRQVNSELTDDEISAVTNNIIEIVGEVQYKKKIIPLSDNQTTILYTATLKAKIDPEEIYAYIRRDDNEKVTIVQQNTQLRDAIVKNDNLTASLIEQYNRATSQAEKDNLRRQITELDREFAANKALETGNQLAYQENYNEAIKFYNKAINLLPNYFKAYNNRGCAYNSLGLHNEAIEDFNKTLELNSNYADAFYNRGNAYKNLEQYERAVQDYGMATKLNPNFAEAYSNSGVIYMDVLQQADKAVENFNKAIRLKPNVALIYFNRGTAYGYMGLYQNSLADFSKAIQLDPNYARAYYNRGLAHAKQNDLQRAIPDFAKSVELNPQDSDAAFNLALCHAKLGNFKRAIANLDSAIKINPQYAKLYQLRGLCRQKIGENAKAQEDFAKAKQLGYRG